jgi:hypothetical protein
MQPPPQRIHAQDFHGTKKSKLRPDASQAADVEWPKHIEVIDLSLLPEPPDFVPTQRAHPVKEEAEVYIKEEEDC